MRNSRALMPPRSATSRAPMNGKALVGQVFGRIDDLPQQVARLRPGDRELRPLVGDRGQLHVEFRKQHLPAEFEMLHHRPGLGGGGGQEIVVVGQPRRGAVVIDHAVLAQHQPVARLADGEVGEGVDVDAVEEGAGIRAVHVDLAERRDIAEADAAAHRLDLARHRFQPVLLARLRIPLRALPQAGVDEDRALLRRPVMRRRQPRRCGNSRRGDGRQTRRSPPAHRAGGRWSCRSRGWSGRSPPP